MREIREIVGLGGALIEMPGAPDFVCGMLNLRGRMVTVVDVRAFLCLGEEAAPNAELAKVLVIEHGGALVGLRVDAVQSIVHVSDEARYAVPRLMRIMLPDTLRDDVREVVRATDAEARPVDLLALDFGRLIDALGGGAEAADAAAAHA